MTWLFGVTRWLAGVLSSLRAVPRGGRSGGQSWWEVLRRIAEGAIDLALRIAGVARCAACEGDVERGAPFCAGCEATIVRGQHSVAPSRHFACETSADAAGERPADAGGERSADAAGEPRGDAAGEPRDDAAGEPRGDDFAWASYEGALAVAVRRFKYGGRPDLARPLGDLLRTTARDLELRADLVVPVPLHRRKLRERGYNQAALLAAPVARELHAPLAARALVRDRYTVAQASLDRDARSTNLEGAFRARSPAIVRGKHVLLVDEVSTTGATLQACRAALLAAGAARVTTLVLARVT